MSNNQKRRKGESRTSNNESRTSNEQGQEREQPENPQQEQEQQEQQGKREPEPKVTQKRRQRGPDPNDYRSARTTEDRGFVHNPVAGGSLPSFEAHPDEVNGEPETGETEEN